MLSSGARSDSTRGNVLMGVIGKDGGGDGDGDGGIGAVSEFMGYRHEHATPTLYSFV